MESSYHEIEDLGALLEYSADMIVADIEAYAEKEDDIKERYKYLQIFYRLLEMRVDKYKREIYYIKKLPGKETRSQVASIDNKLRHARNCKKQVRDAYLAHYLTRF